MHALHNPLPVALTVEDTLADEHFGRGALGEAVLKAVLEWLLATTSLGCDCGGECTHLGHGLLERHLACRESVVRGACMQCVSARVRAYGGPRHDVSGDDEGSWNGTVVAVKQTRRWQMAGQNGEQARRSHMLTSRGPPPPDSQQRERLLRLTLHHKTAVPFTTCTHP